METTNDTPEIPDEFLCPITHEIMREPVMAADAHVYERRAILRWIRNGGPSPMTNLRLEHHNVCPHRILRRTIREWCEENNVDLDEDEDSEDSDSEDDVPPPPRAVPVATTARVREPTRWQYNRATYQDTWNLTRHLADGHWDPNFIIRCIRNGVNDRDPRLDMGEIFREAVIRGNTELVKVLIRDGVDVHHKYDPPLDFNGELAHTYIDIARIHERQNILNELLDL